MTKSTITRERLQEIAEDGFLKHGESKELARMALAAMDSEPVAWKVRFKLEGQPGSNFNKFFENKKAMNDVVSLHELGGFNIDVTPLYLHAQQPVVPEEMTAGIAVKHWQGGRGSIESFVAGCNFFRAAMLKGGKS